MLLRIMSSLFRDSLHLVLGKIDFLFLPFPTSTWENSTTHSNAFLAGGGLISIYCQSCIEWISFYIRG